MKSTLIVYSSTDGQTKKICSRIQDCLGNDFYSNIMPMKEVTEDDLNTAKNQLEQMMQQQQMSAYIASLREKANVRIKSDAIGLDGLSN